MTDETDLVKQLRARSRQPISSLDVTVEREAAAFIEAMIAERDRLKAVNADLLGALRAIEIELAPGEGDPDMMALMVSNVAETARAALARATRE